MTDTPSDARGSAAARSDAMPGRMPDGFAPAEDVSAQRAEERRRGQWLRERARPARTLLSATVAVGMLGGALAVAQAWLIALLFADLVAGRPIGAGVVMGTLAVVVCRALVGAAGEMLGVHAGQAVTTAIRRDALDALRRLGPAWTAERRSGEIVATLMEQIDAIEGFVARYLPTQTLASALPLALVAVVLAVDWRSGLILVGFGLAVPVVMALVGWRTAARARSQMTAMRRMSGTFLDRLQNLPTLKLFNAAWRERDRIRAVAEGFRQRTMGVLHLAFLSSTALDLLAGLAVAAVAISLIGGAVRADFTTVIFVILLVPEIFQPLRRLGQFYHDRAAAVGAAEAVLDVLDAADKAPDLPETEGVAATKPPALRFDRVSLAHEGGRRVALDEVSFEAPAGAMVALVGESGAGKSSILDLLAGYRLPDAGQVTVDGMPADLDRLRPLVARAGQTPRVIAGTLADNLRLGRPEAGDDALWTALETVGLADLVRALPDGLDTMVGEGARGLSGGEARRLGLARVLVRGAPLVLLDEPTANLDADSESGVLAGLDALKGRHTIVVATHAPAVIARADLVIRLDRGRVIESRVIESRVTGDRVIDG